MGDVYSCLEVAQDMAHDRIEQLETDIYICEVSYHSGKEYVFKTRDEIKFGYLMCLHISINHHFVSKENAMREALAMKNRLKKKCIFVDTIKQVEKGYETISHYKICSI